VTEIIRISNVAKTFASRSGVREVLRPVNLEIDEGEFVAFVGPSGCGKSTLLNIIAGLVPASSGEIFCGNEPVRNINTRVGYMTQADSLLPWRTAEDNIQLPLKIRGASRDDRRLRSQQLLDAVGLAGFGSSFPNELSGGMRKRVALAQVLAYDPKTILMDEPFGALDAQLKLVMQNELAEIQNRMKKTIVFVTHDLGEAIALADRIVIFGARPGRVKAIEPVDIPRPRDVFKIRFDPAYQAIYERLWDMLAPEISEKPI
jgi:NitT/TauT family transport system ATP-binding protein